MCCFRQDLLIQPMMLGVTDMRGQPRTASYSLRSGDSGMVRSGRKIKRFVPTMLRSRCPLSVHVEKVEGRLALGAGVSGARGGLETDLQDFKVRGLGDVAQGESVDEEEKSVILKKLIFRQLSSVAICKI